MEEQLLSLAASPGLFEISILIGGFFVARVLARALVSAGRQRGEVAPHVAGAGTTKVVMASSAGTLDPHQTFPFCHIAARRASRSCGCGACARTAFLREPHVAAYLAQRFGGHAFPPALAPAVHQRTDGNPLFTVRVVDELVALRALEPEDDHWLRPGAPRREQTAAIPSMRYM